MPSLLPAWTTRPRILITNDDGVEPRGLLALKQALDPIGDTIVVAPDTNQSAVGHQKTLHATASCPRAHKPTARSPIRSTAHPPMP